MDRRWSVMSKALIRNGDVIRSATVLTAVELVVMPKDGSRCPERKFAVPDGPLQRMIRDAPFLLDVTRLVWRRWKGRHPTGIDRVCLAYLRHFRDHAQAVVQHDRFRRIFDRNASNDIFELLEESPKGFRFRLPWTFLWHLGSANCAGQGRPYLNIGHTGLNSVGFRRWIAANDVKPVYFVHDLIPITHPQFCRGGEAVRHRERMVTALRTAAGVIGNSQATLDELAAFASSEDLTFPPAIAAWLGSEPLPNCGDDASPDRPTFVVLGTIEARKNHLMLLEIWSRLIDRLGEKAPRLLVIGQRGWEADDVFDLLDKPARFRGLVRELGQCSDEALGRHLRSATALLFPSKAEGYGLPLIEALEVGLPSIVSDLPVFHEIGGDIPLYLEPTDATAWEKAILDFAKPDSRSRKAQLAKLQGFQAPDWACHFRRVEKFLASLA